MNYAWKRVLGYSVWWCVRAADVYQFHHRSRKTRKSDSSHLMPDVVQLYTVLDKLFTTSAKVTPKCALTKGISPLIPPSIPEGRFRKYNTLPEKTRLSEKSHHFSPRFVSNKKTPRWGPWGCCNTSVVGSTLKRGSDWNPALGLLLPHVGFWNSAKAPIYETFITSRDITLTSGKGNFSHQHYVTMSSWVFGVMDVFMVSWLFVLLK